MLAIRLCYTASTMEAGDVADVDIAGCNNSPEAVI